MRGSLWRRIPENATLTWRWFKHWRRRYVWLRLIILVLIFAQPVYGVFRPIIRDLVVLAIKGIESAKLGPRLYARAYEFQEKKQLQHALRARFDADGDGLLTEAEAGRLTAATGLAGTDVTGSGLDVELGPLVEGSHKAGLLSHVVSATDIRRRVLERALNERETEHRALWEEVEPMLEVEYARAADYLRWETWERGLTAFLDVLRYRVPFGGHLIPGPHRFEPEYPGQPWRSAWQGVSDAVTMLALLVAIVVSIRRHGKGRELERRFEEEAELAAAPCPVCGEPTHDYGALIQHRGARAWAMAAVIGLAIFTLSAVGSTMGGHVTEFGMLGAGAVLGMIAGGLRWWLWPREVHACHRRRYLRVVGFAVSALVVAALVWSLAGVGRRMFGAPRREATMLGRAGHVGGARREGTRLPRQPTRGRGASVRSPGRRATAGREVSRRAAMRGRRADGRPGPARGRGVPRRR